MASSKGDFEEFGRAVCATFDIDTRERIVVAVSGGLDSTALLRLLHGSGFLLVVAHVNYGLRGEDSDGDEAFVRKLADELGLPVAVSPVNLPPSGNRQKAARDARYAFFRETAEAAGAKTVAVGQHQDDQAETVLLNLFRGAGPHGLSGMPAARKIAQDSTIQVIRPLLKWSRKELESLARDCGWIWREDTSNESDAYARNRLRNTVMPLIEKEFGEQVSRNIAETAGKIRAVVDLVDGGASSSLLIVELRKLPEAQRHSLYISSLRNFAPFALRRSEALVEIDSLLDSQPGKRVIWPGVTVWRERDALVINPEGDKFKPQAWTVQVGTSVATPHGTLLVETSELVSPDTETANGDIEFVDADVLREPLSLRIWRDGDRFNPLGLNGSKLVSDLLTDLKVPVSERDRQLVFCSEDEILWVVGHRLSQEARLSATTRRAVRLAWNPAR